MKENINTKGTIGLKTLLYLCITVSLFIIGCSSKEAKQVDTFICPMHPAILSDHKGACPVCGMDLVRKSHDDDNTLITDDVLKLLKSPNEAVITSIKTIKPDFRSESYAVDAEGIVTYDTKHVYTISSRTSGRLEKLFLKYAFQPVTKGEKIAEVYSPELLTAQRELLFLIDHDASNTQLIDDSMHRLELLGLSHSQVNQIVSKKRVDANLAIFSPYSGYLIDQRESTAPATRTKPEMDVSEIGSGDNVSQTPPDVVREGQYVQSGQLLFRIVSDNAYRIELDLPASRASSIVEGSELQLDFLNGHVHDAKVDFVQPFFSNGQSFIKIRVYTNKMEGLHIGHLVKTKLTIPTQESIWVPRSAVVYLGNESIVFIKVNGMLKPHKVQTGTSAGNLQQILTGVASSDEIAANAQFLVDSESFIKTDNK